MNISAEHLLWILLLAPLGAAVLAASFFRRHRWGSPVLSCAAAGVSLVASLALLLTFQPDAVFLSDLLKTLKTESGTASQFLSPADLYYSYPWLELGSFKVDIGFHIDANAALILFVVTFIAFWVHVFSIGYTGVEKTQGRFFAGMTLFLFSMLGFVVAGNLYMLFFFWELVGFSSYLLIAHSHDTPDAAAASKKAFIVNRIGDLALLVGIVLCHMTYGTVNLAGLAVIVANGAAASTLIGFFFLVGFLAKSAQFPQHIWLPDAIANSTPVSAAIHAATAVAAGGYFMVRMFFLLTPPVLDVMLWSCAGMALLAALCALAQTDIKKSLAYATLSNLGFAGAAIGFCLPEIALLHLAMSAFFQSALFLCAGSIIRACHSEQDMTKMGGLARRMPLTHVVFIFAGMSLCAWPMTAGGISKGTIFAGALSNGNYGALALLLAAAFITALYIGRMWLLVFIGKNAFVKVTATDMKKTFFEKWNWGEPNSEAAANASESSFWMTVPLIVLGIIFSTEAGYGLLHNGAVWLGGKFSGLLPEVSVHSLAEPYHSIHKQLAASVRDIFLSLLSILLPVAGLVLAIWFYRKTPGQDALHEKAPLLYRAFEYRWMDTLHDTWLKRVQQPFANAIGFFDTLFINGLGVRAIGAGIPALLGLGSRRLLHTGKTNAYLFWPALGALLYAAVMFLI